MYFAKQLNKIWVKALFEEQKKKPKLVCYLVNIHITSYLQNIYVYVCITFYQMC
jgi:hypothetical protein